MLNVKTIIFDELPMQDTCWSMTTGKDGRIYFAACGEHTGGLSVWLIRYDPDTDTRKVMREIAVALGEPPDNGHATHSKIHYCLIPASDGSLYGATHCTGAPINEPIWRPWNSWDDPVRMFSGFHLFRYDPATDTLDDYGIGFPNEGSRCMALAEGRGLLYGVTYPRNHFWVYNLKEQRFHDAGRFGAINPQAVWLDCDEHGYTVDDLGFIVKYDADRKELINLNTCLYHMPYRDGSHNTVYDIVPSHFDDSVYGSTYSYDNRLFRYNPHEGPEGTAYDLGRGYGPDQEEWSAFYHMGHIGGMIFGDDGLLYYVVSVRWEQPNRQVLMRMDVETGEKEELGTLEGEGLRPVFIPRATKDFAGRIYFCDAGTTPTGMFVYTPGYVNFSCLKTGACRSLRGERQRSAG
jgi:hypothetical protein